MRITVVILLQAKSTFTSSMPLIIATSKRNCEENLAEGRVRRASSESGMSEFKIRRERKVSEPTKEKENNITKLFFLKSKFCLVVVRKFGKGAGEENMMLTFPGRTRIIPMVITSALGEAPANKEKEAKVKRICSSWKAAR